MIRSIFLGTPTLAVPALEVLAHSTDVRLVITQPDKPRGRSGKPRPPPIKEEGRRLAIPVAQPKSREELINGIESARPFDVGVLAAYGRIVPEASLRTAGTGFLNLHFSLLPRWRGAAPIQHALLAGDATTGVTIIEMDAGLDTGPILGAVEEEISGRDTTGSLEQRLARRAAELLAGVMPDYVESRLERLVQDEAAATYAPRIEPTAARLDLTEPGELLQRKIRAFNPRPGAYVRYRGHRLKIWEAEVIEGPSGNPGELHLQEGSVLVGSRTGALLLVVVQPAGGRRMSGEEWARGRLPLGSLD